MSFCGYCGTQMEDDTLFCTNCGKPLKKSTINQSSVNRPTVSNVGINNSQMNTTIYSSESKPRDILGVEQILAKECVSATLEYVESQKIINPSTQYDFLYLFLEKEPNGTSHCRVSPGSGTVFFDKSSDVDIAGLDRNYGLNENVYREKIELGLLIDLIEEELGKKVYVMVKGMPCLIEPGPKGNNRIFGSFVYMYVDWMYPVNTNLRNQNIVKWGSAAHLPKSGIPFIFGIMLSPLLILIIAILLMYFF